MTLNENKIKLPTTIIIPLTEKCKIRRIIKREPLLFHIILKQGMAFFPLLVKDLRK